LETPIALTAELGTDVAKAKQWKAFVKKGRLDVGGTTLKQVCAFLYSFLTPPTQSLTARDEFTCTWPPAGAWRA
jgi:hypothetical protein